MTLTSLSYPHLNQSVFQATLDNGLRLVILPKPDFRETCAMLRVAYGGIDTSFTVADKVVDSPLGVAHFLEHQIFENHGKEDFSQRFTSLGCDSNAFTGFTSTNYYFSGLDAVEEGLELLQELVGQERFTNLSMVKEKAIIKQEIDMYQDDPDYRLYNLALAGLFPKTPLAVDLAGSHESVDQTSLSDLQEVYRTFYRPDQMTLVVVGDVNPEKVYRSVKSYQGRQGLVDPGTSELVRQPLTYEPVLKKQTLSMEVNLPKLALAFRQPPLTRDWLKHKLALKLYVNMLVGWTSQTYQNWYDTGKLDDSFDVTIESCDRFRFLMVVLDTAEPIAMTAKLKQILRTAKPSKDLSEEHLLTIKKELYGEFLSSLDRLDDLVSLFLEYDQPGQSYLDFPDILDELTLELVVDLGQRFFETADAVDVTLFPK